MPTYEYDRRYVERGLEILEKYLLADAAYWPVDLKPPAGEPAYPQFTLEGLLLSLQRLLAYRGQPADEARTVRLSVEMEHLHNRWQVAWEKKAVRAYLARLNLWSNFLEEYQDSPDAHADRYAYEVRLRCFLSILAQDVGSLEPVVNDWLRSADDFLVKVLIPGNFIWGDEIRAGFPQDNYWFLYGSLPAIIRDHSFPVGRFSRQ
jgi:hypothetical protein